MTKTILCRKKFASVFLCLLCTLIITTFSINCYAESALPFPAVSGADEIYLYHLESDKILYKQSNQRAIAPASTVKIMTGLLAIELLSNRLDDYITVTSEMMSDVEGYSVGIKVGDVIKIRDLLYGLICAGGNDAAHILAYISMGNTVSFVKEMNRRASEWGCSATNYANPT